MVPPCDDYAFVFGSGGIRDKFRPQQARIEPAATSVVLLVSSPFVANCPLSPESAVVSSPLELAPAAVARRGSRRRSPSQLTPVAPACSPWTIGSTPPRRAFDFLACTKVPWEPEDPPPPLLSSSSYLSTPSHRTATKLLPVVVRVDW